MAKSKPATRFRDVQRLIKKYLDRARGPKDLANRIDGLRGLVTFEERLRGMTKEERLHMGGFLSQAACDRIANTKTEIERDEVVKECARVNYFCKRAWLDYLYGYADEKPFVSKASKKFVAA